MSVGCGRCCVFEALVIVGFAARCLGFTVLLIVL